MLSERDHWDPVTLDLALPAGSMLYVIGCWDPAAVAGWDLTGRGPESVLNGRCPAAIEWAVSELTDRGHWNPVAVTQTRLGLGCG